MSKKIRGKKKLEKAVEEKRHPKIVKSIEENRRQLFEAWENREIVVPAYPQKVNIELTNYCNFKCAMCPSLVMNRPKGHMDQELYSKIIGEIKGNTDLVYYHIMGEPILHPNFIDYVREANSKGLVTCLVTNGSLLDNKMAEGIVQSGLDYICISVDGGSKRTQEAIRKGSKWEQIVANIERLANRRNSASSDLKIGVQMTMMYANKAEFVDILRQWQGTVDYVRSKTYFSWADGTGQLGENKTGNNPCDRLWFYTAIGWDGSLGMCCLDYELDKGLGNVKNAKLYELWNSEKMQNLRRTHLDGARKNLPLCSSCGYASEPDLMIHTQKDMTALERELNRALSDDGGAYNDKSSHL